MRTVLMLALLAVGCATGEATPYQPFDWTGGYSESQLNVRLFEVRFHGNALTRRSTVEAHALRRAAELALAHGYPGFVEMRVDTAADQRVYMADGKGDTSTKHVATKRVYLLTADEMRANPAAIEAYRVLNPPGAPDWDAPSAAPVTAAQEAERCRQQFWEAAAGRGDYSWKCREILSGVSKASSSPDADQRKPSPY